MFKSKGLDIIINCNMKIVKYLYVTFKLKRSILPSLQKA